MLRPWLASRRCSGSGRPLEAAAIVKLPRSRQQQRNSLAKSTSSVSLGPAMTTTSKDSSTSTASRSRRSATTRASCSTDSTSPSNRRCQSSKPTAQSSRSPEQSTATCSIRSSPKPDRFLFLRAWPSEVPALDSAPRPGSLVDALYERVEELVVVGSAQVPGGATIVDAPASGDSVPPVLGRMSRSVTTKQPSK